MPSALVKHGVHLSTSSWLIASQARRTILEEAFSWSRFSLLVHCWEVIIRLSIHCSMARKNIVRRFVYAFQSTSINAGFWIGLRLQVTTLIKTACSSCVLFANDAAECILMAASPLLLIELDMWSKYSIDLRDLKLSATFCGGHGTRRLIISGESEWTLLRNLQMNF